MKRVSPPQFHNPEQNQPPKTGEFTMTIRLPPDNILDHILAIFGKKRKIIMPDNLDQTEKQLGPYTTIKARKEGFFKTLFRRQP